MTWKGHQERIPMAKNPNQRGHFFLSTNVSSFVQCLFLYLTYSHKKGTSEDQRPCTHARTVSISDFQADRS